MSSIKKIEAAIGEEKRYVEELVLTCRGERRVRLDNGAEENAIDPIYRVVIDEQRLHRYKNVNVRVMRVDPPFAGGKLGRDDLYDEYENHGGQQRVAVAVNHESDDNSFIEIYAVNKGGDGVGKSLAHIEAPGHLTHVEAMKVYGYGQYIKINQIH